MRPTTHREGTVCAEWGLSVACGCGCVLPLQNTWGPEIILGLPHLLGNIEPQAQQQWTCPAALVPPSGLLKAMSSSRAGWAGWMDCTVPNPLLP